MKKIIFIFTLLLVICLIGSVQAADNSTVDDINVTFQDTVYCEDLGSIDVEIPENVSGNLKATINDVEFYNENVTGSVKVPISIPDAAYPIIIPNKITDHSTFGINLFFNGLELNSNHTLKVMKYAPDYNVPGFSSEVLKDDMSAHLSMLFPESANGTLEVYIDGNFAEKLIPSVFTFLNVTNFATLPLGSHNISISYSGDKYYKKFNQTFNFTVVDMLIHIPDRILLDHDDCITAKIINNTGGTVTVYVDNKMVFKDKLDKYGEFLHSMFDDVTCGEHLIEVQYNATNFTKSKKAVVNVDYDVDVIEYKSYIYGEDNTYVIIVPEDFNKNLIDITVNGKKYTDFEIDNSGWIELDISDLKVGNYTLDFNFKGDDKYYNWSFTKNFTVKYNIMMPYFGFRYNEADVYLNLPKSAEGFLEVYVDGKLYRSLKLTKGSAKLKINDLKPGEYNVSAKYVGDDFNVTENSVSLVITPDITTPGQMYVGEDKSVVVTCNKNAKGKIAFNFDGKSVIVDIKNGKAVLPLKEFKTGYFDIDAVYMGDDGFNTTVYAAVEILASKIKLTSLKVTSESAKMKVYINSKLAKNTYVTFKIDNKNKKIKTDKNGVATIKLAPGKHTVKAVYKNANDVKSLSVHVVSLKSVAVKKSAKKVILTATLKKGKTFLKNKVVVFKFNGKTIKAKTNKKGVAKATFKTSNLKVGKKITYSASYHKDIVNKVVVVKK